MSMASLLEQGLASGRLLETALRKDGGQLQLGKDLGSPFFGRPVRSRKVLSKSRPSAVKSVCTYSNQEGDCTHSSNTASGKAVGKYGGWSVAPLHRKQAFQDKVKARYSREGSSSTLDAPQSAQQSGVESASQSSRVMDNGGAGCEHENTKDELRGHTTQSRVTGSERSGQGDGQETTANRETGDPSSDYEEGKNKQPQLKMETEAASISEVGSRQTSGEGGGATTGTKDDQVRVVRGDRHVSNQASKAVVCTKPVKKRNAGMREDWRFTGLSMRKSALKGRDVREDVRRLEETAVEKIGEAVKTPQWNGLMLLNFLAILYGSNAVAMKFTDAAAIVPPASLACTIKFGAATLAFSPALVDILAGSNKKEDRAVLFAGLELALWLMAGIITQTVGLGGASASNNASLLWAFTVVMVPLLELFTGRRKISKLTWLATLAALSGMIFLKDPVGNVDLLLPKIEDILGLLSGGFFAAQIFRAEMLCSRYDPVKLIAVMQVYMFIVAAGWEIWSLGGLGPDQLHQLEGMLPQLPWGPLLYSGLLAGGIGGWLELNGLMNVHASTATLIYTTIPVWGGFMTFLATGEGGLPSIGEGLAGVAYVIGATLFAFWTAPKSKNSDAAGEQTQQTGNETAKSKEEVTPGEVIASLVSSKLPVGGEKQEGAPTLARAAETGGGEKDESVPSKVPVLQVASQHVESFDGEPLGTAENPAMEAAMKEEEEAKEEENGGGPNPDTLPSAFLQTQLKFPFYATQAQDILTKAKGMGEGLSSALASAKGGGAGMGAASKVAGGTAAVASSTGAAGTGGAVAGGAGAAAGGAAASGGAAAGAAGAGAAGAGAAGAAGAGAAGAGAAGAGAASAGAAGAGAAGAGAAGAGAAGAGAAGAGAAGAGTAGALAAGAGAGTAGAAATAGSAATGAVAGGGAGAAVTAAGAGAAGAGAAGAGGAAAGAAGGAAAGAAGGAAAGAAAGAAGAGAAGAGAGAGAGAAAGAAVGGVASTGTLVTGVAATLNAAGSAVVGGTQAVGGTVLQTAASTVQGVASQAAGTVLHAASAVAPGPTAAVASATSVVAAQAGGAIQTAASTVGAAFPPAQAAVGAALQSTVSTAAPIVQSTVSTVAPVATSTVSAVATTAGGLIEVAESVIAAEPGLAQAVSAIQNATSAAASGAGTALSQAGSAAQNVAPAVVSASGAVGAAATVASKAVTGMAVAAGAGAGAVIGSGVGGVTSTLQRVASGMGAVGAAAHAEASSVASSMCQVAAPAVESLRNALMPASSSALDTVKQSAEGLTSSAVEVMTGVPKNAGASLQNLPNIGSLLAEPATAVERAVSCSPDVSMSPVADGVLAASQALADFQAVGISSVDLAAAMCSAIPLDFSGLPLDAVEPLLHKFATGVLSLQFLQQEGLLDLDSTVADQATVHMLQCAVNLLPPLVDDTHALYLGSLGSIHNLEAFTGQASSVTEQVIHAVAPHVTDFLRVLHGNVPFHL